MSTTKTKRCALMTHVPNELRRKLDAAAKKARRSRSAELHLRLEDSLKRFAVLPGLSVEEER